MSRKELLAAQVPFVRSKAVRDLGWRVAKLEALAEDRGVLIVDGKAEEDTRILPDDALPTDGPPQAVDLLRAAAAKGVDCAIFARRLNKQVDLEVKAFLEESRKGT